MAKDAEIKLILETQEFLQAAKAVGPALQKALDVSGDIKGVENYQKELHKLVEDKKVLLTKSGKLEGPFNVKNLEKYEGKLKDLFKYVEEYKAGEARLKELGVDPTTGAGIASLRGKIGAETRTGENGDPETARRNYAEANKLLERRAELETIILTEYKKEQATIDGIHKKVKGVATIGTEHKDAIEAVNTAYDELLNKTDEVNQATEEDATAQQKVTDATQETVDAYQDLINLKNEGESESPTTSSRDTSADITSNEGLNDIEQSATTADTSIKELLSTLSKYKEKLIEVQKAGENTASVEADIANTTDTIKSKIEDALNFDRSTASFTDLMNHFKQLKTIESAFANMEQIPTELAQAFEAVRAELLATKGDIKDYERSFKGTSFSDTFKNVSSTVKKVTSSIRQGFQTVQRVVTKAISVMRSAVNGFVKLFRAGFKIVGNAINKVKSHFSGMSSSMRSNFKHLITSLTKYVLGFRSLFFLVRRLRKYVGEGIKNLAQFNDGNNEVNRSITALLSSLLYLKNAWAAAFSPIITFITPWLSGLIDKLAEVGNAIAKFVGRLTGQTVVFNAVKVDAQDYAKSLSDVGSSAGGAADKTKKLTDRLAAFDDLNVLGKDNDNDNTGSGGGGGADELYTPDPNEMFKIVDAGQDLLQKLKDMWATADFTELGEIFSDKFVEALNKINWPKIQLTLAKIGRSIGTFLTGALSNQEMWDTVGEAIGEGINSLSLFLNGLLTSSDFNLGEGILTLITSALDTIRFDVIKSNFDMLGDKLIEAINTLVDGLAENDGEGISTLAESLTTFITKAINGIHWDGILAIASTIGGSILDGIIQGLTATPEGSFTNALGNFMNSIKTAFETGDPTEAANGLTTFLSNVFANVDFATVWTNVQSFFNQLFTNIFSSIQIEDDGSLFSGLFTALTGVGETLANVFNTVMEILPQVLPGLMLITDVSMNFINALLPLVEIILPPLNNLIAQITSLISALLVPALQLLQPVFTAIALILDVISPIIEQIVGFITDSTSGTENLIEPLTELVMAILTPLSELLRPIMHVVGILLDLVISILSPIMDLLSPLIEMLTACLSPIFELLGLIGEIIEAVVVPLLTVFTTCVKVWVVPVLKGLVGAMGAVKDIFNTVTTVINGSITFWKNAFKAFGDWLKGIINGWIGQIERFINLLIYGLNLAIGALNKLHVDIPDWVPDIGGGTLGFNIPTLSTISIPRLAQGAVIPPNKEFMAILGDQSHGTNIEAPLDTIKQAVAEASGNAEVIQLLQQLISVVESKNLTIGDKDIGKANARYTQQQKLIRGTSF